jgi:hypothetical protein
MGGSMHQFGVLGSGVGACVVGVVFVALGQGVLRAKRASGVADTKPRSAKSVGQARRERDEEDGRKMAGWAFTVGGGAFLTIGLIDLIRALISAIAK